MKKIMSCFVVMAVIVMMSSLAFAHSGRTDSFGGHTNNSTGMYEYHGF